MRITDKDLEAVVKRINLITDSPLESYTKRDDGKYKANIGNYHLSYAYGGVSLHRMHNDAGGVTTPSELWACHKERTLQPNASLH